MAVSFSDKIHPNKKLRLRFDYSYRAIQYLEYFGLVKYKFDFTSEVECNEYYFMGIKFNTNDELKCYLYENKIIIDEVDVDTYSGEITKEYTIVDCVRIYELFEDQPTDIMNYKLYTVNELCELLSFTRPVIYKLIKTGEIKSIRVNGKVRVKHQDYMEYISNSK